MPTISHFYGIIIVMYLRNKDHNPPHIHAITQEEVAVFLSCLVKSWKEDFLEKPGRW